MITLIGIAIFTKVFVRLPYDMWYFVVHEFDNDPNQPVDPFSFDVDIEPYYDHDSYEGFITIVNTFVIHLSLRVAVLLNITRWSLLYFSLK